jgi:hypothetical protein
MIPVLSSTWCLLLFVCFTDSSTSILSSREGFDSSLMWFLLSQVVTRCPVCHTWLVTKDEYVWSESSPLGQPPGRLPFTRLSKGRSKSSIQVEIRFTQAAKSVRLLPFSEYLVIWQRTVDQRAVDQSALDKKCVSKVSLHLVRTVLLKTIGLVLRSPEWSMDSPQRRFNPSLNLPWNQALLVIWPRSRTKDDDQIRNLLRKGMTFPKHW